MESPATPSDSEPSLGSSPSPTPATAPSGVPLVVAAVVSAGESDDLGATLDSLAAQDYPALRVAVLVIGDESTVAGVETLAGSFGNGSVVRGVGPGVGRAAAANQILELVRGESGLFLVVDDSVRLAPDAVTRLVEEMFRSNAGIVGPKLLDADRPTLISSVGFAVDRFGEIDDGLEPDEIDQEQHDAVRDVFGLSSSCLLVRADLFRRLSGFEPDLDRPIDSVDLCWRAHLSGARVVVVPSAVAYRRAVVSTTDPDAANGAATESDRYGSQRIATVASLTGPTRLVTILPTTIVVALVAALVALGRGDAAGAWRRLTALGGSLAAAPSVVRRRARVRGIRLVPDREVAALQMRGSAALAQWSRQREFATRQARRNFGRSTWGTAITAFLVVLLVIGGRDILTRGLHPVGEMLDLPGSPLDSLRSYLTGWWDRGFGETTAQPTGLLVIALAGFASFAQMNALASWGVLALIGIGWWGAARLASMSGDPRARLAGVLVYAAAPLPYAAVGAGRSAVLVAYAFVPWIVHHGRVVAGLARRVVDGIEFDRTEFDGADAVARPSTPAQVAAMARLALVLALALSLAPPVAIVGVLSIVVTSLAGLLAGGSRRAAVLGLAAALVSATGAVVLNLPWSLRFLDADGWTAITGVASAGGGMGWWDVLRMGIGPSSLGSLFLLAYLPALVALVLARSWRGVWAVRGGALASVFLLLAVASTTGRGPVALPEVGVLLVPVAVGLSISASILVGSFRIDVRGARFGLRQPVAFASLVAIAALVVPVASVAVDGAWKQPSTSMIDQMGELFRDPSGSAEFRVLVVGDAELVPGADSAYSDSVAYNVLRNGAASVDETWKSPSTTEARIVTEALDALGERQTLRVGRLLGPMGVRYVVVPLVDRVRSDADAPRPVAEGLLESLGRQLDLRLRYSPASMVVYENTQWIPLRSVLGPEAAARSGEGGATSLVATELSGSRSVLGDSTAWTAAVDSVPPGVVHLAVPFDRRWTLAVDGERVPASGSFGASMSFAVAEGGRVELSYDSSLVRFGWVVLQIALWIAAVLAVVQPRRRRRAKNVAPALAFDDAGEVRP